MHSPRSKLIAWVAAILVVMAGLIVTAIGMATPVSFGWFAYQPLSGASFAFEDAGIFVSRMTVIGAVIAALGLMCIAFLAGVRAAASRHPHSDDSKP